tara:strand:- start:771 stop:1472 length:702 start_codon:yes stop_codon:yes gene_type:complete
MKWSINNKFTYPKSTRSIYNGSRHYLVDGERLPSVTNIISMTKKTEEKEALEKWKRENKDSEIILKESSNRGTLMHGYLSEMLMGKMNGELIEEVNLPKKMAEMIISHGLNDYVKEVYASEECVYSLKYKYAGTMDALISTQENKLQICDFKQKNSPAKREYSSIRNYFTQCILYAIAHNEIHGTKIQSSVILMCTPNLIFQKFEIEGQEFMDLQKEALERVEHYHQLISKSI